METITYVAKKPDQNGLIHYTEEENAVWEILYNRQLQVIEDRACDEFKKGVAKLQLSANVIPQCRDIANQLQAFTGWRVQPVDALISFSKFFSLLNQKIFPVACFIRCREELDYLKEPDVFHEIFGHCTMLTNQNIADFTHAIGQMGVQLEKGERALLARLYWFTIEFGLVNTANGLKIYGGGILSSKGETEYALESDVPRRLPFDVLTVMRTPYRYDEKQLTYFILNSMDDLSELTDLKKLRAVFEEAKKLGMLPNPHEADVIDHRSC